MARHDQYVAAPGATVDQAPSYLISFIRADNLSNQWYLVRGLNRYIRPQTLGWFAGVLPAMQRLQIIPVDAPAGGIKSAATGGNLVVDVYDVDASANLLNSDGSLTNTGALSDRSPAAGFITTNAVADTETTTLVVAAPGAGFRLRLFYASICKLSLAAAPLAASVRVRVGSGVTFDRFELGLSAQKPADGFSTGDVGISLGENAPINFAHKSDIANMNFNYAVCYLIETQP